MSRRTAFDVALVLALIAAVALLGDRLPSRAQITDGVDAMLAPAPSGTAETRLREKARLAGVDGWRVRASGRRDGLARNIEIVSVGIGMREYILWFEWSQENDPFGRAEFEHLRRTLRLDGEGADPSAPAANIAR